MKHFHCNPGIPNNPRPNIPNQPAPRMPNIPTPRLPNPTPESRPMPESQCPNQDQDQVQIEDLEETKVPVQYCAVPRGGRRRRGPRVVNKCNKCLSVLDNSEGERPIYENLNYGLFY